MQQNVIPSYIFVNFSNKLSINRRHTVIRPISEYACTVWNHNLKCSAGILSKNVL